ncbi:MAG: alpha/beta hydrolase [Corynebacterium sp.]|nr:alpha/beta hydrolase [Corynebacterium sp.]
MELQRFDGLSQRASKVATEEITRFQKIWARFSPDNAGFIVGTIFFILALTPSLLPRDGLYQGVACGLSAAVGYLLAIFLKWNWQLWLGESLHPFLGWTENIKVTTRWRTRIEIGMLIIGMAWIAIMVLFGVRWQRQVAELTNARALSAWEYFVVFPVGIGIWVLLVFLGRGFQAGVDWIIHRIPDSWSTFWRTVTAWFGVLLISVVIINQVMPGTIVRLAEHFLAARDQEIREDLQKPRVPERSGSDESINDWEGLGAYGTRFTGLGYYKEELEELTGQPAKDPIRVYSGLGQGEDLHEQAERVVAELERTNAVEREALLVATTTGTGWINPTAAQAFELLYNGDTAIAGMQYSYLPSAFEFIGDSERAKESGRILISTVVDWWNTLDENNRPKLYIYGESLGVSAGEAAFSGMRDITESVDGVLWLGPPNSSTLWSEFVERRDVGTPEAAPVYAAGMVVRFAINTATIRSYIPDRTWGDTRVLYVQHPSDPVVWWSPDLAWQSPDWLSEPAIFDRTPAMTWYPFITFMQLTLDLPMAANVPNGHGHNYGTSVLDGLAAIAGPERFADADFDLLRKQLREAMSTQGPEKEVGLDAPPSDVPDVEY